MARLNTTSPRKRQDPPPRATPQSQRGSGTLARTVGISNKEHGHGLRSTTTAETSSTKSSVGVFGDMGTSMNGKQSQKKGKGKGKHSTDFQIFYDSDAFVEREAEESEGEEESSIASENSSSLSASASSSSSSSSPFSHSASSHTSSDSLPSHDAKGKNPLRLAHVNSMILPLSQQQPARSTRRPTTTTPATTISTRTPKPEEIDNYDKENDPIEQEPEDDAVSSLTRSSSDASSRHAPIRRNNSQTSGKDRRTGPLFSKYRQHETVEEQGDLEENEDDAIDDSLNDFVVSDNEDLSYDGTSSIDDLEEEEKETKNIPSSPPPSRPRRRLVRGRRPAPRVESEPESEAEAKKPCEVPSHRGQTPVESTIASLPSPGVETQDNGNISDRLGHLNLEDNDPSCQLLQGLNKAVIELDSPIMKPEAELKNRQTPPSSPSKGNRLQSPTKGKLRIPPTPYRESADAFWSQTTTNEWIDQHSPSKVEKLLREFEDSDDDQDHEKLLDIMPRTPRRAKEEPKTPSKTALKKAEIANKKAEQERKKSFDDKKVALAYDFYKVLDDSVANGQIQDMTKETGGVKIVWSKTLQTTAGRATSKRTQDTAQYHATIELAERIIDNEDRLINTLAHEYCHLTNNVISRVRNNPHGTSFKQWGLRCKQALQDHPDYAGRVEVTTKHNYKIDFKYVWACVDCAQTFGRHSKSINPAAVRCGRCKGLLQQVKPKPRNVGTAKKQTVQSSAGVISPVDRKAVDDVMQVLGSVNLH